MTIHMFYKLKKISLVFFAQCLVINSTTADVLFDTGTPGSSPSTQTVRNYGGVVISRAAAFDLVMDATVSSISVYAGAYLGRTGQMNFSLFSGNLAPSGTPVYSGVFTLASGMGWQGISGLNWALSSGLYTLELSAGSNTWALWGLNGSGQSPNSVVTTYQSHSLISAGAWTTNVSPFSLALQIEGLPTSGAPEIDGKFLPQVLLLLGGAITLYRRNRGQLSFKKPLIGSEAVAH